VAESLDSTPDLHIGLVRVILPDRKSSGTKLIDIRLPGLWMRMIIKLTLGLGLLQGGKAG